MLLFIPRSLCALKRVAAKSEHVKFGATTGIRITLAPGLYRAEATDGRRAMIVQGLIPTEDPPWPGFKDLPDDACKCWLCEHFQLGQYSSYPRQPVQSAEQAPCSRA